MSEHRGAPRVPRGAPSTGGAGGPVEAPHHSDPGCVFCKIRDGQIPSIKLHEDERTLAFMDINPLNRGHCLVVTRRHAATLWDSDDADLAAAVSAARRLAIALRAALSPDGLNMLQANGAAAFQSVPHFHLHLIPRWTGDGKGFDWPLVPGDRQELARTGEAIRVAMKGRQA